MRKHVLTSSNHMLTGMLSRKQLLPHRGEKREHGVFGATEVASP